MLTEFPHAIAMQHANQPDETIFQAEAQCILSTVKLKGIASHSFLLSIYLAPLNLHLENVDFYLGCYSCFLQCLCQAMHYSVIVGGAEACIPIFTMKMEIKKMHGCSKGGVCLCTLSISYYSLNT